MQQSNKEISKLQAIYDINTHLTGSFEKFKKESLQLLHVYTLDLKDAIRLIKIKNIQGAKIRVKNIQGLSSDINSIHNEYINLHGLTSKLKIELESMNKGDIPIFDYTQIKDIEDKLREMFLCQIIQTCDIKAIKDYIRVLEGEYDNKKHARVKKVLNLFSQSKEKLNTSMYINILFQKSLQESREMYEVYKQQFFKQYINNESRLALRTSHELLKFSRYFDETCSLLALYAISSMNRDKPLCMNIKNLVMNDDEIFSVVFMAVATRYGYILNNRLHKLFIAGCLHCEQMSTSIIYAKTQMKRPVHQLEKIQATFRLPLDEFAFHTVLVCSVRHSEIDPMETMIRLNCGHVLTLNSLNLIKAENTTKPDKCSVCEIKIIDEKTLVLNF